jgi:hypothetical protein
MVMASPPFDGGANSVEGRNKNLSFTRCRKQHVHLYLLNDDARLKAEAQAAGAAAFVDKQEDFERAPTAIRLWPGDQ